MRRGTPGRRRCGCACTGTGKTWSSPWRDTGPADGWRAAARRRARAGRVARTGRQPRRHPDGRSSGRRAASASAARIPGRDRRDVTRSRARRASVLLVDDQPLLRHSLAMIINNEPDLTVVGEAGDGVDAVALRPPHPSGRDPDGRPDATRRRAPGHPAHLRRPGAVGRPRPGAEHVRARRIRLRGAARRRVRLPAQGRPPRGADRGDPPHPPRRVAVRARRSSPGWSRTTSPRPARTGRRRPCGS